MSDQLNVKTGMLSPSRREFLKKTGAVATMSMFGAGFFTACSNEDIAPDGSTSADGITINSTTVLVDLTKKTVLQSEGGWLLIPTARILVVNTGSSFRALTSVCTHSGCSNNWSFTDNEFVCNCHGSRFTTSGQVISGPASSPLRAFRNSRTNNVLAINRS